MANDVNNVAEENFNKFRESLYQYYDGSIKDFDTIKPQLLDIFKTHRPIRRVDYEYGISKALKAKSQLIVHECNQRSMVREYFRTGRNVYQCCECNRTGVSKNDGIADLLVVHGIVFVKLEHDCAPRQLSVVQKVQKLYKEKKMEEADALQKKVLGSEDLIVVSSKQKNDASKCGTKASSSKRDDDIIAEVRLRYAQLQEKEAQEFHPSIGNKQVDENQDKLTPEEAFTKIIKNLEEYTNESKEAVMANKSKIFTCLKTHRPIKSCDYLYGLTANLKRDQCLIVFEWGDRRRVRQYTKRKTRPNLGVCCECYRLFQRQKMISYPDLYLVSGIVFVASNNHHCEPRDYLLVMQYQKFLEDGNTPKANRMVQVINFTYGVFSLTNVVNVLDVKSALLDDDNSNKNNSKALTNLKHKMASKCNEEMPPVQKKSKLNKSTLDVTVTDENGRGLHDEKVVNVTKCKKSKQHVEEKFDSIRIKSEPSSTSIYHFEKPSTSKLQEICGKLNIEYRNKAAKLWDKIMFDQIDTASKPTKTHSFETDNFYQILSIFFTGKSKQHKQIQATIIDAFREKMISSGEISTKKFNKHYLDTVTGEHLSFIAKFLLCRILIFDGENGIQKYGKWKSNTSIRLTLVVALVDGYYSIVLKL